MIEWKASLELGVPEIDADHRTLVELLNRIKASNEREEALIVLDQLESYADYHFAREEALMEECGYEFSGVHVREHRDLRFEVKNQIEDLMADERDIREVAQFMQRWLLRHIAGSDRLLSEAVLAHRSRHPAHG